MTPNQSWADLANRCWLQMKADVEGIDGDPDPKSWRENLCSQIQIEVSEGEAGITSNRLAPDRRRQNVARVAVAVFALAAIDEIDLLPAVDEYLTSRAAEMTDANG